MNHLPLSPWPTHSPPYDLLVTGGTVVGFDGAADSHDHDIAISNGLIVDVAPRIDRSLAASVMQADGQMVTAGLVDLHTHVYPGVTIMGAPADRLCLPSGVTTTVDAGSCGSETFEGFRRLAVEPATARVFCFINLSRIGLTGSHSVGELLSLGHADARGAVAVLDRHADIAVGVKVRLSRSAAGDNCLSALRLALAVGEETGTPVHVHIGDTETGIDDILALLRPGDMVTHMQTPKTEGLLDERGRVRASVHAARAAGVLFDCGHGRTQFSFDVAARLLDEGFQPDTISTDMSATSYAQLAPGLLTVMNKWLALGVGFEQILPAVTSSPAAAIRRSSLCGGFEIGGPADLALLSWQDGEFVYDDTLGKTIRAARRLVPSATIRAGEVVWRQNSEEQL
jgi:dihydroorotase